jgi:hypothetical protein
MELKLREAINSKFVKSKINNYMYNPEAHSPSKSRSGVGEQESESSREMGEYSHLLTLRAINIKEYHEEEPSQEPNRKYHIRMRLS